MESGKEIVYVDANIIITAALDEGARGGKCREFLTHVAKGKISAFTNIITVDEAIWIIGRNGMKETAANVGESILNLRNLKIIDLNSAIMREAVRIYREEKLAPKDAIHLASMRAHALTNICSYDHDFDAIKEIKRVTP